MLQTIDDAIIGYKEIHRTGEGCRFNNCQHMKEPGCAVKAAVEAVGIDARRYESYRRSVILMEQLTRDRY
jgi:ribosome biogenesis GTPase